MSGPGLDLATRSGRERNDWGVSDDENESQNNDKAMSSSWPRDTQ